MSKTTEQQAFETWKAEIAAKLTDPAEKAAFDKVADLEVFKGNLRTQEFHKRVSDLDKAKKDWETKTQSEYRQMGDWYTKAQAEAAKIKEENDKLKLALRKRRDGADDLDDLLDPAAARTTDDLVVGSVKKEDLDQLTNKLQEIDRNAPAYTNLMMRLGFRAIKENLEFDPEKLFEAAQTNRCDLERAFDILAAPTRAERAEADVKARIEKAREEARAEALSNIPPDRVRAAQAPPPAIARLFANQDPQAQVIQGDPARVSAAVAEWAKMQAENRQ